jgi:rhamnogalacturonyl hydrolase YesR
VFAGASLSARQDAPRFDAARTAPLDVARVFAARYPEAPSMSYIPALAWSGALRLSILTGESRWADRARREMQPFLSGEKPTVGEKPQLASLGGHIAFADLVLLEQQSAAADLARKAADLILPQAPDETVRFASRWTDDIYMAGALLSRVASLTKDERYVRAATTLATSYAAGLQRPDGLFVHATSGPHAWGRGNGFAALGLADILTYLPDSAPDRAKVVEIVRTHAKALLKHQSEDGSWRQVVDEPASYQELTVTALTLSALARGIRLGWLDGTYVQAIDRAWTAILARVGTDGTLRDVCTSTGAGPTKEYYLNRPIVNGADDRGGAMVLLAALELEELRNSSKARR